jgi:ABC-2 type transport system ATP-binding protein
MCGRDKAWLAPRVPRWLERVGMTVDADRKVREYSKGMQQRIGLAQALVHDPEIVFLDEPTDGVDPVGRAAVREMVQELKARGTTIFINSHLLMEVELVCDRVVIMTKGRILREGSIDDLTPRTGNVRFELRSVPDDLATLLDGVGAELAPLPSGFELKVNQDELDLAIDRLRAAGVGIRTITQRRLSLEESFIHLVREDPRR